MPIPFNRQNGKCSVWVRRYRNAMSALRPFAPQSRTLSSCGAANDAKGHKPKSDASQFAKLQIDDANCICVS